MNIHRCIDAIEKLNAELYEIKNSREYLLGKNICDFFSGKKSLFYFFKKIFLMKRVRLQNHIPKNDFFYNKGSFIDELKKVAVYTCVVNKYDCLEDPILIDNTLDYYLFSDKEVCNTHWVNRPIPKDALAYNYTLINRFCKLNPFFLFPNYDYSIYIDGNIQIISDVRSLCAIAKESRIGIAMHSHCLRNCAYQEADVCVKMKKGNCKKIVEQMDLYQQLGFPKNFGLFEATIIVVDLHNEVAKYLMREWWDELKRSQSERDQLSFPYVLWKNGFNVADIGCLGNNRRKNPVFRTTKHSKNI